VPRSATLTINPELAARRKRRLPAGKSALISPDKSGSYIGSGGVARSVELMNSSQVDDRAPFAGLLCGKPRQRCRSTTRHCEEAHGIPTSVAPPRNDGGCGMGAG